ncbi:erythromycin esterase family protein [Verrucosispora sp. NA02020]|uniref:erythromycin esterase family protein n=1 Tax=Verrucosispora sp. NA02020 TaxID=2742132 RepID=UPI00159021AD|nr:erythromycin esterase family protein [Verrucosispora sp. NA02020]QKW14877.1 erythromycin esterase family protein [Verrucosispora sp. NA02020]
MSGRTYDLQRAGHRISSLVDHATIVGLGTSTREAHELFGLVEQTTHALVESGFRVVAVLDNPRIGERYDQFVQGQQIDLDAALGQAWGPWRTTEMREALGRLRRHNERHPADPVRIVAIGGSRVLPADYDRAVGLIARRDATTATRVTQLFDVIRTAHDDGEHVRRARGTHPGTPFVDLARTAHDLVAGLDPGPERDEALPLLDAIVAHHANAIGVGHDLAREERAAADRLLAHQRRTGDRIVLWEGSARVATHEVMTGGHLRAALGDRYAAVHLAFGHGRIPERDLPRPSPDSLEAVLLTGADDDVRVVDLRAPHPTEITPILDRPARTRVISGMYDPERDEEHYHELPSPRHSFDVVAVLPTITPIHPR